jgi:predicted metal-dependent phosphoesterase TrpH
VPSPTFGNADLHSHSTFSDGALTPEALAARARENGVELWSLTDHDELAGQRRARDAALDLGLAYLAGCEVSVGFAGHTVHVLGLGIDADDAALAAALAEVRSGRLDRARRIGDELGRAGIPGAFDGALALAENPALVARTHFARWLVERGVCGDVHEVFRRYLSDGKPGDVPHRWARLGDAVRWIGAAGGVAVIAHPARYGMTANEHWALFSEFVALGGRGVEVTIASHSAAEERSYTETALEFGLLASRGSDFHAPRERRVELGALPALPGRLTPVWKALAGRIERR